ncbi:hypothetical protein DH2020_035442 [Rehmannia glutinosa]|uniref:Pentatricopeptide repeat-containing protein n=1 Tax=Rehmannia glutinosa TaxID=99300 RepID=A0ABR0V9D3_REHGL
MTVQFSLLIDSLCHSRKLGEAVRLTLSHTLEPHKYSIYLKILQLCTDLMSRKSGHFIHSRIIADGFLANTCLNTRLIIFYSKIGEIENARKVFDRMSGRSVVTWTALISGYSHNADYEEALRVFSTMHGEGVKANQFTYGSALSACTRLLCLERGKQIQGYVQKRRFVDNLFVQSALVDLHSKCGKMEDACRVFESMETRDLVSWNAMIGGYVAQGLSKNAVLVFRWMLREGMLPDIFTFGSVLRATVGNDKLAKVNIVHGYILQFGFGSHKFLNGSLIDAYVKCGNMDSAIQVYNNMQNKDVVSCTALIKGYACEGSNCTAALQLFNEVQRNMAIDGMLLCSMFNICAKTASLSLGRQLHANALKYQNQHDVATGNALIDMYSKSGQTRYFSTSRALYLFGGPSCRRGRLEEAYDLICKIPADVDASVLGAILGACSTYGDMNLGEIVARRLFSLEPENPANYVVLSGIYAAAGLWNSARETRMLVGKKTSSKYPGYSICQSKEALPPNS